MNFLAFLLPLGLYLYWFILGKAALTLLYTQRQTTRSNFLAPIIGFSILQLAIFLPNWFGLPVKIYASYITIFLFALSVLILYWKKPILFCKQEGKFYLLMLAGYTFFAFPLFKFGFHWYSFGNFDMAGYYCLTALRYIHNGYNTPFNVAIALSQKDYTQFSVALWNAAAIRCGSSFYLAWLAVCTRLSVIATFMPLICAQNLLIFSGVIAISYKRKKEAFSLLSLLFIIISPLNTLGVVYQLLGQVSGMALLLGCSALVFHNFKMRYPHVNLKLSFLIGVLLATLSISYPEISPFLILSMLIYYCVGIWKKNICVKSLVILFSLSLFFTLCLTNTATVNILKFLFIQINSNQFHSSELLFPYFLKPNGAGILLGFFPIAATYISYVTSFYILLSLVLLFSCLIYTFKKIKATIEGYHCLFLVMFATALFLLFTTNGFGLFKIAMYLQPFLALILADLFLNLYRGNKLKKYLILFLTFFTIVSQINVAIYYIYRSYGSVGTFVEVPYISAHNLEGSIQKMIEQSPDSQRLYLNTQSNIVISELLFTLFYGHAYDNISRNYRYENQTILQPSFSESRNVEQLCKITFLSFPINGLSNQFDSLYCKNSIPITYIISLKDILNIKSSPLPLTKLNELVTRNPQDLKNYLVFINSILGYDYYLNVSDEKKSHFIGRYGPQIDWYFKNDIWQVFGEYSLYQIINPTHSPQLVLNLSRTVLPNKKLPTVNIIGVNSTLLPIVGYGSARIVSPPIISRNINGKDYIMLDLGPATKNPIHNQGLNKLYNRNISLDNQFISAYVRGLSLYDQNELKTLKTPSSLSQFPTDLKNPNLFYSGVYEDGWIGNNSYVILNKKATQKNLEILLNIPQNMRPTSTLTIWIDDKPVTIKTLSIGEIKLILPVTKLSSNNHKIHLQFSKMILLPTPDNRPVSGKINFIGFIP